MPGTGLTWRFRKLVARGSSTQSVAGIGYSTGKRLDCLALSIWSSFRCYSYSSRVSHRARVPFASTVEMSQAPCGVSNGIRHHFWKLSSILIARVYSSGLLLVTIHLYCCSLHLIDQNVLRSECPQDGQERVSKTRQVPPWLFNKKTGEDS